MASSEQRGQTKRKSSELGQVFEVSDGDLSPEEAPPPSKLAKTSVAPSPPPNLEVGPEQIHEISDDSVVGPPGKRAAPPNFPQINCVFSRT